MADEKIVQTAINTIRTLSMDAVQQANSGHPGTPMSMAPVVYCLWQHFLRFDKDDPIWQGVIFALLAAKRFVRLASTDERGSTASVPNKA